MNRMRLLLVLALGLGADGCVRFHFDPGGGGSEPAATEAERAADPDPLRRAVWAKDPDRVARAAAAQDPDTCGDDDRSPLGIASLLGEPALVEALLAAGANPDLACDSGTSPIQEVMNPVVESRLSSTGSEDGITVETAALPDLDREPGSPLDIEERLRCLDSLFEAGADPNGEENDDTPPILTAIFAGEPRFVRALLRAGADPGRIGVVGRMAARAIGNGDLLALADRGIPNPK